MKKNNQTLEVLEPEVEEIPLEQVIDQTLVRHNVTDAVISSLKAKYSGMQLKSLDDKESYLDIKEARKEVRKIGILTEKLCKKGREDAVTIQRKWLAKEKEILGKIEEVENPLNIEIEKFENEVERKELAEKKRQEEIYINRQTALSRMGAVYDNGSYVLNHISYEVDLIKAADNDMWNDTIYPKYKREFEAVESQRVMEENKRKAEMEQAKKEREEFEAKQAAFKKEQELFAQQQVELQRQKDDISRKEAQQKLEEQRKIDAEKESKWRDRLSKLNDIGWNGQFAYAKWNEDVPVFTYDELINLADDIFYDRAKDYINSVALRNKELEEKKLAKMEEEKQVAIQKALEDEKIKQEQEKQQKEIEMAQANDKGKYADVVSYLKQVPKHEMKSSLYKSKMRIINDFIQDL